VDVMGEEDGTDRKMDEVHRPSVVFIETEYEVSIVTLLYGVFVVFVCVYNSGFVLLADFTCVKQLFLFYSGK